MLERCQINKILNTFYFDTYQLGSLCKHQFVGCLCFLDSFIMILSQVGHSWQLQNLWDFVYLCVKSLSVDLFLLLWNKCFIPPPPTCRLKFKLLIVSHKIEDLYAYQLFCCCFGLCCHCLTKTIVNIFALRLASGIIWCCCSTIACSLNFFDTIVVHHHCCQTCLAIIAQKQN